MSCLKTPWGYFLTQAIIIIIILLVDNVDPLVSLHTLISTKIHILLFFFVSAYEIFTLLKVIQMPNLSSMTCCPKRCLYVDVHSLAFHSSIGYFFFYFLFQDYIYKKLSTNSNVQPRYNVYLECVPIKASFTNEYIDYVSKCRCITYHISIP